MIVLKYVFLNLVQKSYFTFKKSDFKRPVEVGRYRIALNDIYNKNEHYPKKKLTQYDDVILDLKYLSCIHNNAIYLLWYLPSFSLFII